MATTPDARPYTFTPEDTRAIARLRDQKYATWEWNYGRSPEYNFRKAARTAGGGLEAVLRVENGTVAGARIYGDYFSRADPGMFEAALVGVPHHEDALRRRLSGIAVGDTFVNVSAEELLSVLI